MTKIAKRFLKGCWLLVVVGLSIAILGTIVLFGQMLRFSDKFWENIMYFGFSLFVGSLMIGQQVEGRWCK
jgi:hypothetical protein